MKQFLWLYLCLLIIAAETLAISIRPAEAQLPTLQTRPTAAQPTVTTPALPVLASKPTAPKSPAQAVSTTSKAPSKSNVKPSAKKATVSGVALDNACYLRMAAKYKVTRKKLSAQQTRVCKNLVTLITKGKTKVLAKSVSWIKEISFSSQKKAIFTYNTKQIDRDLNYALAVNTPATAQPPTTAAPVVTLPPPTPVKTPTTPSTPTTPTKNPPTVTLLVYDTDIGEYERNFVNGSVIQSFETVCFKPTGAISSATFKIAGSSTITDSGSLICLGGKNGSDVLPPALDDGTYTVSIEFFNAAKQSLGTSQITLGITSDFDIDN